MKQFNISENIKNIYRQIYKCFLDKLSMYASLDKAQITIVKVDRKLETKNLQSPSQNLVVFFAK